MIELLQYWFLSAALLAAVGWCVETVLRNNGKEARWVWVATALLTLASPLLTQLWSGQASAATGQSTSLPAIPGLGALESASGAAGLGLGLTPLVGVAWGLVSLALLAAGALALGRLRRDARTWRRATVLGEDVLVSDEFGPAVVGVLQPRIVVPQALPDCDEGELEMMLHHELEHIRCYDPLLLRIGSVVGALMPWNLAFLWQIGRLRQAVEQDCDLRVIARGVAPRPYGTLLVKMAARPAPTRRFLGAAALAESRSGVARRLRLLQDRSGQTRTSVTALLIIAGAAALAVWIGVPSPVHFSHWFNHDRDHGDVRASAGQPIEPVVPVPPVEPVESPAAAEEVIEQLRHRLEVVRERKIALERTGVDGGYELQRLQEELKRQEHLMQEAVTRAGASIRIRRTSESGADAELKPLVYVDGVRMYGDVSDLDPDQVERIEVLKGEAAYEMFGEEAAGGVIQIFLKVGAKKPGGS